MHALRSVVRPITAEDYFETQPTDRVRRLREAFFTYKPTVELERIRVVTRVFRETEGEPMICRRAKAFAAVVEAIAARIFPDELIVGFQASRPRGNSVYVDQGGGWYQAELPTLATRQWDQFAISEEDRRELLEEIIPYWKGTGRYEKTVDGRVAQTLASYPETNELLHADPRAYPTFGAGLIDVDVLRVMHIGHLTVDYPKVIEKGFTGIREEVEARIARCDPTNPDDISRLPFLRSIALAMEASAGIGRRFAATALNMLSVTTDPARRSELEKIAEVCERVPAHPARTFHEALQALWFTQILLKYEANGDALSPGRIDQYLYPYYEEDLRRGRLTKEDAQELADCLFLKFATVVDLWPTNACRFYAGFPVTQQVNVGGVKRDGSDATNDLSYLFIEAMMHTRLTQPTFSVRVHNGSPEPLLLKAAELTALGSGHPSYFNDEVVIPSLLGRTTLGGRAVSLADARDYSMIGCVEPMLAGMDAGYSNGGILNLAGAMELALTNGVHRATGRRVGAESGDPRSFSSFAEVQEAFAKQVRWLVRHLAIADNVCELAQAELYPTVYLSALLDDCIEAGTSREAGGARYNFGPSPLGVGVADCGDSLAAIRKIVFEDRKLTMSELCDALESDFRGYEDVRRLLLGAPKFGNDDDYVDKLAAWVVHIFAAEMIQYRNTRGGHLLPGVIPVSANVPLGMVVGALPSGRKAGVALAEGCSPFPGMDRKGPTGGMKSVSKINHAEVFDGTQYNMRIEPSVFREAAGIKRLADLVRTFVDLKAWHVQFNVVSSDTLRAAQREPEKYRDIVVKVAGYNAFFVELDETIQNNIIERTEHRI
jgi:formate C-acetyltransferase